MANIFSFYEDPKDSPNVAIGSILVDKQDLDGVTMTNTSLSFGDGKFGEHKDQVKVAFRDGMTMICGDVIYDVKDGILDVWGIDYGMMRFSIIGELPIGAGGLVRLPHKKLEVVKNGYGMVMGRSDAIKLIKGIWVENKAVKKQIDEHNRKVCQRLDRRDKKR